MYVLFALILSDHGFYTMQFKQIFEQRYNKLWNGAVSADTALRNKFGSISFFGVGENEYLELLIQYADITKSILGNLQRQFNSFSDPENASDYFASTISATKEDFIYYSANIIHRLGDDSHCSRFVSDFLSYLSTATLQISESSMGVNFSQ